MASPFGAPNWAERSAATNLADGGGRTDGQVVSGSLGGGGFGWILVSNRFINGAAGYTGGLFLPVTLNDTGLN